MQPHDRLVRAEFWKDRQFLRGFTWMERTFYQGLWSLADDSGCLYDDPGDIKHELARYDDDITTEWIAAMLEKLVAGDRAVRYKGDGEPCIWLVNFSKHQTIKNPRPPEVPLAPWLSWTPYESNASAGKYLLSKDVLRDFLASSETPLRDDFHSYSDSDSHSQKNVSESAREEVAAAEPHPPLKGCLWLIPERQLQLAEWRKYNKFGMPPEQLATEVEDSIKLGITEALATHLVGYVAQRSRAPDPRTGKRIWSPAGRYQGIVNTLLNADPPVTTVEQFEARQAEFEAAMIRAAPDEKPKFLNGFV